MATILSMNATVKNGVMVPVGNENRPAFSNQAGIYTAIWLEDFDGSGDSCYLFTSKELLRILKKVDDVSFDLVPGRLNIIKVNGKQKYLVKFLDTKDNPVYGMLTEKELLRARYRVSKNPEDVTKKSFFRSIIE